MAKTTHTARTAVGTKSSSYSANAADLTMVAANVAEGEQVTFTGKEIVVAHNTGASDRVITISSVADALGRTGDVSYTLGAGEYAVFGPFGQEGWQQTTGYLYFAGPNAEVKFGVIRLT